MGPDNDSIKVACMSMVRELPITSRIARKQQPYWALLGLIAYIQAYIQELGGTQAKWTSTILTSYKELTSKKELQHQH